MLLLDVKTGAESIADGLQLSALLHLWQDSKNRTENRGFEFDPVEHRYTLKGLILPNVTRILKTFLIETKFIPQAARDRGTYIHRCIEMYHNRTLDFSALTPEFQEIVWKWHLKLNSEGLNQEIPLTEHRMYSSRFLFAGTADLIFPEKFKGAKILINAYLKTNPVRWEFVSRELQHAENHCKFMSLLSAYNQIREAGDPRGLLKENNYDS